MRQSLLTPDAMIGLLWKAVCVEMRLYSLGRGQQRRAEKYLAGALLHLGRGKDREVLPIVTLFPALDNPLFHAHTYESKHSHT